MIASSIMAIMVAALAGVAMAVRQSWDYSHAHGDANLHAQVALARIARAVSEATTTENLPGVAVAVYQVGTEQFPDTLVVWNPAGAPQNATGPPLVRECVFYCPDPVDPRRLVEITAPADNSTISLTSDITSPAGLAQVDAIKAAPTSQKVLLTPRLRVVRVTSDPSSARGCVRFVRRLRPSAAEWASYKAGTLTWANLSWPQTIYGSTTGLRQAWVRSEIQLVPGRDLSSADPDAPVTAPDADELIRGSERDLAVPFFGSASVYYDMPK